jgi:predicted RNA-binding protein with TRAM domain
MQIATRARRRRAVRGLVALAATALVGGTGMPAAHADPTVPDPPTIKFVQPGDGTLSISYDVNGDGGDAILHYTASCISGDGGAPATVSTPDDTPSGITLPADNGHAYTCTMTATNGQGDSAPTAPSTAIIAGTPIVGDGAAILTSSHGLYVIPGGSIGDSGSAITNFTASCTPDGGGPTTTASDPSGVVHVTGLTNGVLYDCTIYASNARGDGPISDRAPAHGTPAAVPDPVIQIELTPGDDQISINFTPPNDNGSPIIQYGANCTDGNGGHVDIEPAAPLVVTGLTNGTTYQCIVVAQNINGTSDSFAYAPSATPAAVPDAPNQPNIIAGDAQISVAFAAPNNNGNAITRYDASCSSNDGGTTVTEHAASSPIVVTGATNGTHYTCTVTATNAMGTSGASPDSAADEPVGAPPAPPQPSAVFGNASATVTFSAPVSDGGSAITSYDAECTSNNGGTTQLASDTQSPITVNGLDNGKTYTCHVRATSNLGTGPYSVASTSGTPSTVPGAPGKPALTPTGTTVSAAFAAPGSNGGATISSYTVTCDSSDGGTTRTGSGASSPVTVNNLSKGKTYTCTVTATNVSGTGAASTASDAVTIATTVPDAPGKPAATPTGSQVSLVFTAPADDGGASITGDTATCTTDDNSLTRTGTNAASPITVLHLRVGHTYTCAVTATNGGGSGTASAASDGFTVTGTAPGPPGSPSASKSGTSADVTFTPPADDGGSAITGYSVSCISLDGGTTRSNTGSSSPITVTNLDKGKTYHCSVRAVNDVGPSVVATASSITIDTTVPGAPTGASITPTGTSMSVTFTAPTDTGGLSITGYTATCTSSNGGTTRSGSGASSPVTVDHLSKGKTYTCTVKATNNDGDSSASTASSSADIATTVPGAPTGASITPSGTSMSVGFTAPADTGGLSISGYTATCTSSNGGATRSGSGASTPVTVTNLDKGKTYTCTVVATNTDGDSSASSASSSADMATTVPGAPAAPTLTKQDGAIDVAFSAPADDGGATISGDTATCTSSDGGATGSQSGGASPITVAGLTNGKTYTCTVHASNTDGDGSESAASSSLLLSVLPANSVAPAFSGSVIAERTLTATNGTWNGAPPPTYTRQWKRCNTSGTGCVNIGGATHTTYVVTNADIGMRLKVVVTATNAAGSVTASRTTVVVRPVPASISGPFYYKHGKLFRSIVFSDTAAAYGDTVWAATPNGDVVGPHYGPHGGTLLDKHLNKPIIGMQITPDGKGYWLFAGDGGVFTFGNAHFYGSTGSKRLNAPIVEMATTPDGRGYWLFAADGGVFTFGNAHFYGSTGGQHLAHPVVAMLPTLSGHGYWLVTADGRAITFGDATNIGSVTSLHRTDIVGLVSTGAGYRFVTSNLQLLAPH